MSGERTRILYVEANEDHTVGGSHQALYDLVGGLDRTRYEPVVLFYQDNAFAGRLRERGVETHVLGRQREREHAVLRSDRSRLRKLWELLAIIVRRTRLLRRLGIDLVHLNDSPLVGYDEWIPAAELTRTPCVASCMCILEPLLEPLQHPVHRLLVRRFDRILPVSDYVKEVIVGAGIPRSLMTTVHHGVDARGIRESVERDPAEVRRELGLGRETILVAMVGNIRRWKGQHVVLAALSHLDPEELERIHVIFAGDVGPENRSYREQLDGTVRREGLADCVSFLGYRDDVPDLINAADIAVHASVEPEPGGIIVLEAMSLGAAVVAAGVGGHTEALTEECGMHFDTREPEELADALRTLIHDPRLRDTLGRKARRRIEEFSIARNVRETQRVYEHVLNGGRRRRHAHGPGSRRGRGR